MAFPSEKSVTMPHRQGTLNFYDDKTHVWLPPFDDIVACLRQNKIDVMRQYRQYRPPICFLLGAVTEPYSAYTGKVGRGGGTWALYGFESVLWGRKRA